MGQSVTTTTTTTATMTMTARTRMMISSFDATTNVDIGSVDPVEVSRVVDSVFSCTLSEEC